MFGGGGGGARTVHTTWVQMYAILFQSSIPLALYMIM